MNILGIPNRTMQNPSFTMKESNSIIGFLKAIHTAFSRQGTVTEHGISFNKPEESSYKISVYFGSAVDPYGLFWIKFVDKEFHHSFPIADLNAATSEVTTKHAKAEILVTNGPQKVKAGSTCLCDMVGFSRPYLVRYTSTVPTMGDRLRLHTSGTAVRVNTGGQLLAVTKPDTYRSLIWVARHDKSPMIYGKLAGTLTYGSSATMNIWRNEVVTSPLETETVWFTWEGVTGNSIPSGAKMTAFWWGDLNNGLGRYRVALNNCVAS